MAVHHGKEGEVVVGGSAVGELVSFTLETTGDVVESTKMADAAKTFVAGRTSFSGTLEMHFDEADSVQTQLTAGASITFKLLPLPMASDVVVHSPTPSKVKTAALSKGDG